PEAEEVRDRRMEVHAAMRLAAMQVQRHRENRQLGDDEEVNKLRHPRGVRQAVVEEIEQQIKHGRSPERTAIVRDGAGPRQKNRRDGLAVSRYMQQQSGHSRGISMPNLPLLQLQGVSRTLAGRLIVDNVNFELD